MCVSSEYFTYICILLAFSSFIEIRDYTHGLLIREIFILSRLIDGAGYHYFKAGSPYLGLPHIRILFC